MGDRRPDPPTRMVKVGSSTRPRCAGCGREIKKGNENTLPDGRTYGDECAARALTRMNERDNPSEQEYAL